MQVLECEHCKHRGIICTLFDCSQLRHTQLWHVLWYLGDDSDLENSKRKIVWWNGQRGLHQMRFSPYLAKMTLVRWTRVGLWCWHPDVNCQWHLHLDFDCHVIVILILIIKVIVLIVVKIKCQYCARIIKAFNDANIHGRAQSFQHMVTLWLM